MDNLGNMIFYFVNWSIKGAYDLISKIIYMVCTIIGTTDMIIEYN